MAAITSAEKELLIQFRSKIGDVPLNPSQNDDYFLVRYIRARENDLDKAKDMLKVHMEYRKERDIDNIMSWTPPADLVKLCPCGLLGFSDENFPVLYAPFGRLDYRKIINSGFRDEHVRQMDRFFEEAEVKMEGKFTPEGIPVTQFIYIADVDKMSLMVYSSLQVMDLFMEVAKAFEAYHPERVKRIYVLNAGRVFTTIYALLKPILGPRTLDKIRIYGTNADKYKADLHNDLPKSILPPYLGGTNVAAENFAGNDMDDDDDDEQVFLPMTIPGGEKFSVSLAVDEKNSTISWAFKTEKYDISFGVTRDGKAYIENNKVDAHVNLQEGTIACDQPGDYIFTFDNTYSRLRSKLLSYRIDVKGPSGLKQISFD